MIIVRLCGGLGNQLFQYAAARRLAHVRGAELVLDTAWFGRSWKSAAARTYDLGHYPVAARPPSPWENLLCRLHGGRLMRLLPWLPRPWRHVREWSLDFNAQVLSAPDGTYMDGYWQSASYFEDISGILRRELVPCADGGPRNVELAREIGSCNAIALHVRRGDYVTHASAAQNHGVCSLDYYARAIEFVLQRVPDPCFYVFSDDPEWTRNNLDVPGRVEFVTHNGAEAAFMDIRLMSLCKHQIIANSSFSWWGAWLNENPDKIVVAPSRWYADGRDMPSLIPMNWIRL